MGGIGLLIKEGTSARAGIADGSTSSVKGVSFSVKYSQIIKLSTLIFPSFHLFSYEDQIMTTWVEQIAYFF